MWSSYVETSICLEFWACWKPLDYCLFDYEHCGLLLHIRFDWIPYVPDDDLVHTSDNREYMENPFLNYGHCCMKLETRQPENAHLCNRLIHLFGTTIQTSFSTIWYNNSNKKVCSFRAKRSEWALCTLYGQWLYLHIGIGGGWLS